MRSPRVLSCIVRWPSYYMLRGVGCLPWARRLGDPEHNSVSPILSPDSLSAPIVPATDPDRSSHQSSGDDKYYFHGKTRPGECNSNRQRRFRRIRNHTSASDVNVIRSMVPHVPYCPHSVLLRTTYLRTTHIQGGNSICLDSHVWVKMF